MTVRVTRDKFFTFLQTDKDYNLIGEGVQELTIEYNADSEDVHYIHEKGGRQLINGYSPSFDTEQIAYEGDPIFEYVDKLRRSMDLGADAETSVLLVYPYASEVEEFEADKFDATIQIGSFGGTGGESLSISYTVALNGDPQRGTVEVADGVATFTKESQLGD